MRINSTYRPSSGAVNWIKIGRGLLEHPIVGVPDRVAYSRTEAWIWLVQNACFKPEIIRIRGRDIELKRAQLVAAQSFLAKTWRWKLERVRWYLEKLEREKQINKHCADNNRHHTVITIRNYDTWQGVTTQDARAEPDDTAPSMAPQAKNKEFKNSYTQNARAREGSEIWRQELNPQNGDYSLDSDGALRASEAAQQRWLPAFGGDMQRFAWALAAITVQPNSTLPLARQAEQGLAKAAAIKRDHDARWERKAAKPATQLGAIGVTVRDTSESFAEYAARMAAEGKYKP